MMAEAPLGTFQRFIQLFFAYVNATLSDIGFDPSDRFIAKLNTRQ